MYAIIRDRGMQYRVEEGQVVEVARLNAEPGSQVELGEVLLVGGAERTLVGAPLVAGAKVLAQVLDDVKGEKIVVFRYKNKKRYRRRTGHRQQYTRIAISRIVGSDEQAAEDQQPATASPARDSSITLEGERRQPAPDSGEADEQAAEDQQPATASSARDSSISSEGESREPVPGPGKLDEGADEQE